MKRKIILIFCLLLSLFSLISCKEEGDTPTVNPPVTEPENPTEPSEPEQPSDPQPENPTEPSEPEQPSDPEPEIPVDDFDDYGMNVIEIDLSSYSISEDELYTQLEEVGIYIYTYHKLPSNYRKKSEFNRYDYTPENKLSAGGDVFQNREGLLPKKAGRTFTECDIDYQGGNRNAKRIVYSSDFLIFYTDDHYLSFSILKFI